MRRITMTAAAALMALAMMAGPALAEGAGNPQDGCLGEERAERNSAGGDREKGDFGPAQSDFAQANQPYGQWLKDWRAANC